MLLLYILRIILLIIIFLLAMIIFIPYTYIIGGNSIEKEAELSILWLFGIIKISFYKHMNGKDELVLSVFKFSKNIENDSNKETKKKTKGKKINKKKTKKTDNKKANKINWKNHINQAVINELVILLKKIWRRYKPQKVYIDAKVGFDDPMTTGLLYGLYCQFSFLLKGDSIQFQPEFNEEVFEGKVFIRGSIWIFYLLMVIFRFLLSFPIRNQIKRIRKEKGGA